METCTAANRVTYTVEADARLRNAAPELLEALIAVVRSYDCNEIMDDWRVLYDSIDKARAAIAKAEGR